jgi:hypothetical protein
MVVVGLNGLSPGLNILEKMIIERKSVKNL